MWVHFNIVQEIDNLQFASLCIRARWSKYLSVKVLSIIPEVFKWALSE